MTDANTAQSTPVVIEVAAEQAYDVVIGRGLLGELPTYLDGASKVAIIHAAALGASAEAIRDDLADQGFEAILIELPNGEDAKAVEVVAFVWEALGTSGFTRSDAIVGLGGGATTDVAGFAAATWLRGIRVVHIPTTLLAMVDAAVGGKTGINTSAGKNLVGSFHSPSGVLCDINALDTLPRNDLIAGMAEVVKVGFTSDATIVSDITADPTAAVDPHGPLLAELIRRAVQVKADVVARDFKETGAGGQIGREVLNYGHTLGHAIERVENYEWRHGAAISVGMVYVAELARLGGKLSDTDVDLHRDVLTSLGLPTTYAAGRWERLLPAMQMDKKSRGNTLRFVVLQGMQHPIVWQAPDPSLLVAAYEAVSS
ncbi:MAG TPA: 3-dehydroquinate synthase, partial [Candidatus Nanopelagicales bacterium]|nr:3-dehydroquinate synthase [Candidatus Nanopelagicales bacterium]